jgi:hypothetical protein
MSDYKDPYQRPDQLQVRYLPARSSGEPNQIQVRHSVRRRRGLICLCVLAVTIGSLLILFQSPLRNELLAPGPLTSHHAQILAGMGGDRCAACHTAGKDSWLSWTGLAKSAQVACPTTQSELCLKCHQQTIPVQLAANPHSLDAAQLAELTEKHQSKFRLAGMQLPSQESQRELSCAACHHEHHGAEIDLTAMTDQQCQTCHTQRHQSFEKDHPDFALVGTQLPSTLNFDHATHFKKYFPEGQQEFACAQCHVGDSQKNVMTLASFETMCSSCHQQTIRTSGQQGLVLLELPMLDLERLRSAGVEVGAWPKEAQGDFAGRLHPLTWALLYRNEALRDSLEAFPADFDFSDLDVENRKQLEKLGVLVSGMKQLMLELGSQDLSGVMGLASSSSQKAGSSSGELQFFRDAVAAWFPEMAAKGGLAESTPDGMDAKRERVWLPRSEAVTRWLQEQELLAPNPLAGKVSPNGTSKNEPQQAASAQVVPMAQPTGEAGPSRQVVKQDAIKNALRKDDDNSRQERETELPSLRGELATPEANLSSDSEQLAENPLQGLKQPGKPEVPTQAGNTIEQDPSDSIGNLGPQRKPHAPPHTSAENQPTQAPAIEPVFSALSKNQLPQPASLRGWRRDDQSLRLVYYVAEHGDSFWPELQRWQALLEQRDERPANQLLTSWLSKTGTAGDCLSCHKPQREFAATSSGNVDLGISWHSAMRLPERKGFTRFSHAPHLLQLKCNECHQLTSEPSEDAMRGKTRLANWSQAEEAHQAASSVDLVGQSDFAPIGRSTCIQCHRQDQASSSCTTCHAYHVDQQWAKRLEQLKQK